MGPTPRSGVCGLGAEASPVGVCSACGADHVEPLAVALGAPVDGVLEGRPAARA